jgi:hypothetical protein
MDHLRNPCLDFLPDVSITVKLSNFMDHLSDIDQSRLDLCKVRGKIAGFGSKSGDFGSVFVTIGCKIVAAG